MARGKKSRYHIECSVSISKGFSKLTAKHFSVEALRDRVQKPKQRRTIDFYAKRKFGPALVRKRLAEFGFRGGRYSKVIVSWEWTDDAARRAAAVGIDLWDFRSILREIANNFRTTRHYFADDTLRTLQLYAKAVEALGD